VNVSHADRCPDCHRVRGVVESNKPKGKRFCWVRNGAICMQTQLAYERALVAPLRLVLEQARAVIAQPFNAPACRQAVIELAGAVVKLDAVEPPLLGEQGEAAAE
jgi:hypothetical protein